VQDPWIRIYIPRIQDGLSRHPERQGRSSKGVAEREEEVNSIRWSEADYADYKQRVQLPIGRGVEGLDRPKRVNTSAPEWQEAYKLIAWTDGEGGEIWPEVRWLYAIPNGGFRHKAVAGKMKAQGVRAGVPDFALDVARGGYHGLRIELKRRTGGALSPAQRDWIAWLTDQGYLAVVCKGWEEARDKLIEYLRG
jgi:hypothetical protein